jgi:beta-carotene ketolase (CrtO type)
VISELPRYRAVDVDAARLLGVEEPLASTSVVTPDSDSLAGAHRAMGEGRISARPPHVVNIPSVIDSSMRLPSGEHVLSLETLFAPYALADSWVGNRAEPERWLEGFGTLVEPGFLESVQRWRVVTPADYEVDLGQPRGQALSYGLPPLQAVLGLERDLTRYETMLPGLYLTGVATYPGGGVWGAPGRNAAGVVARALVA